MWSIFFVSSDFFFIALYALLDSYLCAVAEHTFDVLLIKSYIVAGLVLQSQTAKAVQLTSQMHTRDLACTRTLCTTFGCFGLVLCRRAIYFRSHFFSIFVTFFLSSYSVSAYGVLCFFFVLAFQRKAFFCSMLL